MKQREIKPRDQSYYQYITDDIADYPDWISLLLALNVAFGILMLIFGDPILIICIFLHLFLTIKKNEYQKKDAIVKRTKKAQDEADSYTEQLNDLIYKSEEIVNDILPYLENNSRKFLESAKIDFKENALSPFWDKIENASKSFALFKEAVDQLQLNGELYSKILNTREHNFPIHFPIGTNISISEDLLLEFNNIVRKAQCSYEFTNIWVQIKTQKILIAGFSTLENAINNMADRIANSIDELNYSIKSEFKELKNNQIEQIRSFEEGNKILTQTLNSMDNKLYYLQYKEKPYTPFVRPINDL